ncbi:hypothetical protein AQUCO_04400105v1 [Aquilegia coerulea]|uniref:NADH dehydrogenase [ubiquinone] 1 alpha subcomplex assembly factor 3 n=1 Tax=Aquilegia coerulea TaxID=218851 RepID=A0A2G5CN45_AQUCA|nr:hypothetical protein AQUCO_04400105v1 [Aquilegia coerulea]
MAVRHKVTATLPYLMRTIRKESPNLSQSHQPLPSLRRAFSLYDQINLIDNVPDDQLRFQGYTATGFTVNGVDYEGSVLCVGNLLMSWTPKILSEITPESLSVFKLIRPVPEILILGSGRYVDRVNPEVRRFVRSTGMKLEELDSRNAASTYNILNEEGRIVAAAMLPYGVSS